MASNPISRFGCSGKQCRGGRRGDSLTKTTGAWHGLHYILKSPRATSMNAKKFFTELKRRKVYRVAVTYAVLSWLLIQIATQVFPFFEIPPWTVRLIVVTLALGFPVALLLSWVFDLTPSGIKRTDEIEKANGS